jgi:hypothetical protein
MVPALLAILLLLFALAVFQSALPDRWEVRVLPQRVVLQRARRGRLRVWVGLLFAGLLGLALVIAVARFHPLAGIGLLVVGGALLALAGAARQARGQVVFDQEQDQVRHGWTAVGQCSQLTAVEWQVDRRRWQLVFGSPDQAVVHWELPGASAAQSADLAEQMAFALSVPWRVGKPSE